MSRPQPSGWDTSRRVLAFVVILSALVVTVLTYTPALPLCRDQLASSGVVARVCGPLSTGDLPLLGMILLVALALLWPDLSEGGVAGLVSWKRRVEAVETEARALKEDVRNVEAGLVSPTELANAVEEVEHKAQALSPTTPVPPAAGSDQVTALLQAWEALRPYQELKISPGVQSSGSAEARELASIEGRTHVSPLDLSAIRMWQDTYQKELRDLRIVRNAVAHGLPQQDHALASAVDIAERLKRSLDNLRLRIEQAENASELDRGGR